MYFWPPEGLGLGLEIVVAEWVFRTCFEQSASGSGRYVETPRNFLSNVFRIRRFRIRKVC
jgi:hypothetical protein